MRTTPLPRTIRHVCLDKDGTLIDVHAYWADISRRRTRKILSHFHLDPSLDSPLCRAMGIDPSLERIVRPGPVGYQPRTAVVEAVRQTLVSHGQSVEPSELQDLFSYVDRELQEGDGYIIRSLGEIREALTRLKKAGYRLSVYSSDRTENIARVLDRIGVANLVDATVGGDEVTKPKPDPEGFLEACDRVGVSREHSVYVGDTVDDMLMACACRSGGAYGVTCGLASREDLSRHTSDVFAHLGEMTNYLLDERE